MSFEKFRMACAECWKDDYGFFVVDKDSPFNKGRYRKGLDPFFNLQPTDKTVKEAVSCFKAV